MTSEQLYDRHYADLLRFAYARVGSLRDAEDAVQDAMVLAIKHWGAVRDQGKVKSWAYSILANVIRSNYRRTRTLMRLGETVPLENANADPIVDSCEDVIMASLTVRVISRKLKNKAEIRAFQEWMFERPVTSKSARRRMIATLRGRTSN